MEEWDLADSKYEKRAKEMIRELYKKYNAHYVVLIYSCESGPIANIVINNEAISFIDFFKIYLLHRRYPELIDAILQEMARRMKIEVDYVF